MRTVIFILLGILFLLHWGTSFLFGSYIWWGKPEWDGIFLFTITLLVLHWIILRDCCISWAEKRLLHTEPRFMKGFYHHPSLQFYQNPSVWSIAIVYAFCLMYILNVSYVFLRNQVPSSLVILFAVVMIFFVSYKKIYDYIKVSEYNMFQKQIVPEWLKKIPS
jgi:FlaA1/EpsC-like NDP-sugar epimerase